MKKIVLLILLLTITSCSKNKKLKDSCWALYEDKSMSTETPLFPCRWCFKDDSLTLIDGFNYKQQVRYKIIGDSIELLFSTTSKRMEFEIFSDSSIVIGSKEFYKTTNDSLISLPYKLIGYKTEDTLEVDEREDVYIIHLINNKGALKVILNDKVEDLKTIPNFLYSTSYNDSFKSVILYLEERTTFKDLLEVYVWIKNSNINSVKLVTDHQGFSNFYALKDTLTIDASIIKTFREDFLLPPFPLYPKKYDGKKILKVNCLEEFEQIEFLDSIEYLIELNTQLNILGYFKILKEVNKRKNVTKKIVHN